MEQTLTRSDGTRAGIVASRGFSESIRWQHQLGCNTEDKLKESEHQSC
jgi:hypothetical protein